MFGLTNAQLLGLTVVAAIVSTIGSLAGIVLKDFLFSRSFEKWKQRQALQQLFEKYRDPLVLSARELCSRLIEILEQFPPEFLSEEVLRSTAEKQRGNTAADPYFQRYKLVSTVYRFAALLGWIELYRQEVVFLHAGDDKRSVALDEAIASMRGDLADGHLNKAPNWHEWSDILIFREELRAIGECMIEQRGASRSIIGYGKFCELFEGDRASGAGRWISTILNFLFDLNEQQPDFRHHRLKRLLVHLAELIEILDPKRIDKRIRTAMHQYRSSVQA